MILQLLQSKQTRGRERGEGGSPEDARSREGKERKECAALEEEGKESWDGGSSGGGGGGDGVGGGVRAAKGLFLQNENPAGGISPCYFPALTRRSAPTLTPPPYSIFS